ncbi:hypothetical protein HK103_003649 [Boothiomyces macroporosus]|uniref:Uncharacterized protein n=1 Tax=Boothiomyces macroporosus TaxID=261099 RepID=A0AAD5UHK0_9FUNG|nr:hypothetical protein HK103_003649 [Boothiomyces macroporosus]
MSETTNTTADINLPSLEKEGADERKVIIAEKKPRAQTCRERKPVKIERPKSSKSTGDLSDSKDPFAYRHFHTFFPSCNRLLAKKWEDRAKSMHLQKLHEAKPTIDNAPPKIYPHLEIRLKKLKLEEGRSIQNKPPHYLRQNWLLDRRQNLDYLKSISEYPQIYIKRIKEFDDNKSFAKLRRNSYKPYSEKIGKHKLTKKE